MSTKDQAAKIADEIRDGAGEEFWYTDAQAARMIRKYGDDRAREERERCVKCIDDTAPSNYQARYYINAINAPAKKRTGNRKGKR